MSTVSTPTVDHQRPDRPRTGDGDEFVPLITARHAAGTFGELVPRNCVVYVARMEHLGDQHRALLDLSETQRRARFTNVDDRDRFTLAAVLLRIVVGQATGVDAAAVAVSRRCEQCGRQHGRPLLPGVGLHASVSHSRDVAAVALTAAGPVGVDVELVQNRSYRGLLSSVCTPAERALVKTSHDFYTYWTRKEAILKAMGKGIENDMSELLVAAPQNPPSLLSIVGQRPPPCSMAAVEPDGYAGAVAVLAEDPVTFTVVDAGIAMLDQHRPASTPSSANLVDSFRS